MIKARGGGGGVCKGKHILLTSDLDMYIKNLKPLPISSCQEKVAIQGLLVI